MAMLFISGVGRQFLIVLLVTLYISALNGQQNGNALVQDREPSKKNVTNTTTAGPTTVTTEITATMTTTPTSPPPSTTLSPQPSTATWSVRDKDNTSVCILLQSGIRMKFNYKNNTSAQNVTDAVTDVPTNSTKASGECGDIHQHISLTFFEDWDLTVKFERNKTDNVYYVTLVTLKYHFEPHKMPFIYAASYSNTSNHSFGTDFCRTDVGRSYKCLSQQTVLPGHSDVQVGLVSVDFYDTQMEAFRVNTTSMNFSAQGGRCSEDEMNLLVPIIVGACLAGLIVIVLIAYFIGRHRSKRGYESV